MSPSLPTPAFLYILNIFLSPTLQKFPFFHNCHATPKGHGLPPPQKKNSERAPKLIVQTLEVGTGHPNLIYKRTQQVPRLSVHAKAPSTVNA